MSKVASTIHFLVESKRLERSALLPITRERAPNKIDLPAPVSPVIQVSPFEKETSKLSIRAKLFILR